MNQAFKPAQYNLITTAEFPCPYDVSKQRRVLMAMHGGDVLTAHENLVSSGFQRRGNYLTKAFCRSCRECTPVRVRVSSSVPGRTQRKTIARNARLRVVLIPADFHPEHFDLYKQYQSGRHPTGEMAKDSIDDYAKMIKSYVGGFMAVFTAQNGQVVMVGLFELLKDAIVAHHSWFDLTQERLSLGTHNVLWLIELARKTGREFVYLGDWLRDNRKLSYKAAFSGAELLVAGVWNPVPVN